MSVEITFQPAGLSGLVAVGSYLIDAARRMGLRLPADCEGRGECMACAVSVVGGQALLSAPTAAERAILGDKRIAQEYRLACQARIEKRGKLEVRVMAEKEPEETNEKEASRISRAFSQLPLQQKLATLVRLEAVTMSETLDAIVNQSLLVGERIMDRLARAGKSKRRRELEMKCPPEHRRQKAG